MMPDFPIDIRIRLAQLKKKSLHPDVGKSLPRWLSQFSFSKLNSEQLRFLGAHPNVRSAVCTIKTLAGNIDWFQSQRGIIGRKGNFNALQKIVINSPSGI